MNCPDCGVQVGEIHLICCNVERCRFCGGQRSSCDCTEYKTEKALPWEGELPGVKECEEFGWFAKLVPGQGWVSCEKGELGWTHDVNRLYLKAKWDPEKGRFVLPPKKILATIISEDEVNRFSPQTQLQSLMAKTCNTCCLEMSQECPLFETSLEFCVEYKNGYKLFFYFEEA